MDVDECSIKSYKPVQESLVLTAYASSESLKRGDVRDVDEGSGQKFRDNLLKSGTSYICE